MGAPRVGSNMARYNQGKKAMEFDGIARRVRGAIDASGLTQSELCRRTGLSSTTMQSLVHGTSIPLMVLVSVARQLNVTLDSLIPGTDR